MEPFIESSIDTTSFQTCIEHLFKIAHPFFGVILPYIVSYLWGHSKRFTLYSTVDILHII